MRKWILSTVCFMVMKSILSENPTCWKFDFNDPSTITQFRVRTPYKTLALKSYADSQIEPYRPTSQYYLSTNILAYSCDMESNLRFRINMGKMVMKMATKFQPKGNLLSTVSVYVTTYVNGTVGRWGALARTTDTVGWTLLSRNQNINTVYPDSEESEIGIGIQLRGVDSVVAIEYLSFYHPELTDENCVPLQTLISPPTETPSTSLSTETVTQTPSTMPPSTNLPPNPMKEIDFQTELQQCDGLYLQLLTTKLYANSPLKPLTDNSLYYLTNIWEGMSCMESTSSLSLNENSVINSAVYFDFLYQGAWLTVSIFDILTGLSEVVFTIDNNLSEWRLLNRKISRNYDNARIMIQTNMNSRSTLAIEYLNILNL